MANRNLGGSTIWIYEHDIQSVPKWLFEEADVRTYTHFLDDDKPWVSTPKWRVDPNDGVVIGANADILVMDEEYVISVARQSIIKQAILGTMAYIPPFDIKMWERLFKEFKISEDFIYEYGNVTQPAPYYINNGAVVIPSNLQLPFRESLYDVMPHVHRICGDSYFYVQVATTIAIYTANLARDVLPRTFNYTELDNPDMGLIDQVAHLHYNVSGLDIVNSDIVAIKKRIKDINRIRMI